MKTISLILAAALSCSLFTACETPGEGAKHGAMIGAGIGALETGSLRGAVRGAAIGAASGAILGKLAEHERHQAIREGRYYDDDRYYEEREYRRSGIRVARPTNRYGFVTSPYPPFSLIDVRRIPHGAEVVDPSTDRIFINP
jgi:hypothetical protein